METKVRVDSITDNMFRQGEKQAMLRMEVITGTGNNLRDSLFSAEELGKQTFTEKRVDWIDVPSDATVESVQALIDQHPKARIYKILHNEPILSDAQESVLKGGLSGPAFDEFKATHGIQADSWNQECAQKLYDTIAESQKVRYGEGNTEGKPADEPVLDRSGRIQFRVTYFSKEGQKDIDYRTGVAVLSELALADNPVHEKVTT